MSAIFEEVTITWGTDDDGEPVEYTVTPTYRMIQQIEQRVSIAGMSSRIINGDPPVSHMAEVIAILLRNAGAKVSPDDVYAELMTSDDPEAMTRMAEIIITAFVPQKKSGSQGSARKKKGKK